MPDAPMHSWTGKISSPAQLGGIETSVLDNGPGRGTRIAWINTGTGLRYKVVIDRAMDIADAFYNQHSLTWLNHSGVTAPQPFSNRGTDWLRTFGGGLLTTCGLDHIGGPEKDEYGERGLHGPLSNIPAHLESILQPDPPQGIMDMSITGIIRQTPIFGPSFELKRTITGRIGESSIFIHDQVLNLGNSPTPHMILYHFNFGWPLVDEGTAILWKGNWKPRYDNTTNNIFRQGHDFRTCPAPMAAHSGRGEEVGIIDPTPDNTGRCTCGLFNLAIPLALALHFQKLQLPCLTNWQHWGRGEYVTGLEPGTNPPVGQAGARQAQKLLYLEPGEVKKYDLQIDLFNNSADISHLLKTVME